ncbi:uncharacterized protein STEHIDRAFT_172599 [Stereum hirsutum FP-91666 SS1]|uniref:Uncharacterized protein n=1 Tax=Stereum hirsutum (strain FP-91666) TaxID=721885 RepID=R7RY27_STEHR|nr:uncharacterized protein STEHIDRAFT_172599 [Stereum hirsutum FP-91666 SS1]EIM80311.1 hypothetical protein STEHIDRAFT_172599 [Stereum hirsutum FP-91666 SS1]
MAAPMHFDLFPQPAFDFLSRPPPQKKRPAGPPPPTPPLTISNLITTAPSSSYRRSSVTGITTWASKVIPGTPAPTSPPTTTPTSGRRPSLIFRRSSVSWNGGRRSSFTANRRPSASFLNVAETPIAATPSFKDCKYDLSALGYTYAVVPLPTPMEPISPTRRSGIDLPKLHIPTFSSSTPKGSPTKPHGPLHLFRSRFRSKSISASTRLPLPSSPSKPKSSTTLTKPKSKSNKASRRRSRSVSGTDSASTSTSERKKSTYANLAKHEYTAGGASLQRDVALMQFMGGGSHEKNIKNVMRKKAKAERKEQGLDFECKGEDVAVDEVWRDGKGGIWRDEDEALEYHGLLDGYSSSKERVSREWVGFGGSGEVSPTGAAEDEEERRGSVSTQDSDLDPRYVVPAASTENVAVDIDINVLSHSSPPAQSSAPGITMLTVPSRPNRLAPHLRKAPSFILEAFVPRSPPPVPHQRSRSLSDAISSVQPVQPTPLPKGKERRRPAALDLRPIENQTNLMPALYAVQGEAEFLSDSFEPAPTSEPENVRKAEISEVSSVRRGLGRRASVLNLGVGLLMKAVGGAKKENGVCA